MALTADWQQKDFFTAPGEGGAWGSPGAAHSRVIWSHTRRPRCFSLWTHGSASFTATYETASDLQEADLSSRRGCSTLAGMAMQATLPKSCEQIERCVIASFRVAESMGLKGEFRQRAQPPPDQRLIDLHLAISISAMDQRDTIQSARRASRA